jgi:hypothetical protein
MALNMESFSLLDPLLLLFPERNRHHENCNGQRPKGLPFSSYQQLAEGRRAGWVRSSHSVRTAELRALAVGTKTLEWPVGLPISFASIQSTRNGLEMPPSAL